VGGKLIIVAQEKPHRCHAMTVSALTITTAARHPVQRRASTTQNQRSDIASRTRRGRPRQHLQLVA
jgi:hypothetical protein